jgi:hypothetical protein
MLLPLHLFMHWIQSAAKKIHLHNGMPNGRFAPFE